MGLTIHYGLTTDQTDINAVRLLVQNIHQLAKQLPFQEVRDLVEFEGEKCQYEGPRRTQSVVEKSKPGKYVHEGNHFFKVAPLHVIAFTTIPGEGSEPANFGLARYPEFVEIERPRKQRLRTNMLGWSWKTFCKTQYASDPAAGGVANFVRCHLSIVELLDAIQKRQLAKVEVNDESDYWDHRDVRKLAETVGEWNEMVAAVAGQLKDAAGGFQLEAPITQFSDFEHLEAKGRDKLDKRPI